nr:hypothetical protein CFP56_11397 [Quercus suber]
MGGREWPLFAAGLGGVGKPGSCLLAVLHSAYTISVCYRDYMSKAYVEGWMKVSRSLSFISDVFWECSSQYLCGFWCLWFVPLPSHS